MSEHQHLQSQSKSQWSESLFQHDFMLLLPLLCIPCVPSKARKCSQTLKHHCDLTSTEIKYLKFHILNPEIYY